MMSSQKKVGLIGCGSVGRNWAILFAGAGYKVVLFDSEPTQLESAFDYIKNKLEDLKENGLLKSDRSVSEQLGLISTTSDLKECVSDAKYIQESVSEDRSLKEQVFAEIDKFITNDDCILASSASTVPISSFTSSLKHKDQCIVAHPSQTVLYSPFVEIAPASFTRPSIVESTVTVMKEIGTSPVLLKKELNGLVSTRLQAAMLAECFRLVKDDAISVEHLDTILTDGLGVRYAFMGPMETINLNAEGVVSYCDRYGKTYSDIADTIGPNPDFCDEVVVKKIAEQINQRVPPDTLDERRKWCEMRVAALAKLKKNLDEEQGK